MVKIPGLVSALTLGALLTLATGCRIEDHKNGDGKNDDVKIATPFGGMSVKTNESVVDGAVGLTVYPGSIQVKKQDGKGDGAADINMNFGSFHLGVKAISYRTPDPVDKVLAFYRKDMAHFGTVILCTGDHAVGIPDHTQDGLTCDKEHGGNIHVDDDKSQEELKAGSKLHQHIVAIETDGRGTKVGLIALDLPGHLGDKEDKD
jgi:hypothetical protein